MEGGMLRKVVVVNLWVVAALVLMGQCSESGGSSFKDCYIKCYVFCIIEPSQTLCSCTTQCFKDCILPSPSPTTATTTSQLDDTISIHAAKANHDQNHAFCKLGCASSLCSNISTNKNPNGDNVESCVGSCSEKCTNTY